MDAIRIKGGRPLQGDIRISGSKNAALPLMAMTLLTDQPVWLENVPELADIRTMTQLLRQHGATLERQDNRLAIQAADLTSTTAPYDIVRKMRASVLVLGPLLAREGEATVSLPGGCAIGTRPIDLHIKGLEALGADIDLTDGYVHASAPHGLQGGHYSFPVVSVGATENILMAATLAKGETLLENAAREPEICDLARGLQAMGAEIDGIGSDQLRIVGKPQLHGAHHRVIPDRIETGTYAAAVALAGGTVTLHNTDASLSEAVLQVLQQCGVQIQADEDRLTVARNGRAIDSNDITTQPYPGFPTDMQAQIMALMCTANGAAVIREVIFENRFMHVPELLRMGADITVNGNAALVRGVEQLSGAQVMATDLRASVSLVLAGLAARGETQVNRVYHLDRGYEAIEEKLSACGADIERINQ